jgi:uncharacterized protein YkwD
MPRSSPSDSARPRSGKPSRLRLWSVALLIGLLTSTLPLGHQAYAASGCSRAADWAEMKSDWAGEVLALTNAHRENLGLTALVSSGSLTASAEWKAAHMAYYRYMTHEDPAPPVDRDWSDRVTACGYTYGGAGENIAYGYKTPQLVFDAWLNSAGHRRNIENANYRVIGVGAAVNSDGRAYWAQNFGTKIVAGDASQPAVQDPTPSPEPSVTAPEPTPSQDPAITPDPTASPEPPVATPIPTPSAEVPIPIEEPPLQDELRNDAPVASDDKARARPRRVVVVRLLANDLDADGDELSVKGFSAPRFGFAMLDYAGGLLTYRPRRGTAGRVEKFRYSITDSKGGTGEGIVRIKIKGRR